MVKEIYHLVKYIDYLGMSKDAEFLDTAPILAQAARAQVATMMSRLAARGFDDMTPAFAAVIPLLDATGERPTALAQRAGVTKQAMGQLLKLLKHRNYVEQVPDPSDTRAKVVRLTKRGVALRAACMDVRRDLHTAALKALGKKELASLQKGLQQLIASMNTPG
jgi:DNA-binding MarR family transcriptional regulator